MKRKQILFAVLFAIIAFILIDSFQGEKPFDYASYLQELEEERTEKNAFFKKEKESPLSNKQKKNFRHLFYYAADTNFIVDARIERTHNNEVISIPTSDGSQQKFIRYGYAIFALNKIHQKLLLLQPLEDEGSGNLFLPFFDQTSARETYGGGRYLDLEAKGPEVRIDFNRAYNPYCAYNAEYSCPIPPAENELQLAITAGEKNYE